MQQSASLLRVTNLCPPPLSSQVLLYRYATRPIGLWFDLVTTFPFSEIVDAIVPREKTVGIGGKITRQILNGVKTLKLLRLVRILRVFAYMDKHLNMNKGLLNIVKQLIMLVLLLHWFACIWYLIALTDAEQPNGPSHGYISAYDRDGWVVNKELLGKTREEYYLLSLYWFVR